MDNIWTYCQSLWETYSIAEIFLVAAVIVLFFIQLYYYVVCYARIPSFRNNPNPTSEATPEISIIVVLREDFYYLENTLPKLLSQNYDKFEIVIVAIGSSEDFTDELSTLCARYSNLSYTKFEQDPRFPISNKMALNVGIKAARYEHIIITTFDAYPVSDKWLKLMAKGFEGSEVVLGYCGLEEEKGLKNKVQRCSRLMMSVRYLAWAIKKDPYRGIIQNIGLTKKIYFDHKGFNHLNMNVGEDDLFIQHIASRNNTGIVMNPNASVKQKTWEDETNPWRKRRLFNSYTYRFYPVKVKNYIEWELGSRILFILSAAAGIVLLPIDAKIFFASLLLLRLLFVIFEMRRICKRLGENGLMWIGIVYDIIAPFSEFSLYIGRTLRKVNGVWR